MSEKVLKELIKSRNELKKKFRSLKVGEAETFDRLEDTFKPITKPLKLFIDESKKNLLTPKKEISAIKNETANDESLMFDKLPPKIETSTPKSFKSKSNMFDELNLSKNNIDDSKFYSQTSISDNDDAMNTMNLSELGRKDILDTLYGPHKNTTSGEWMFANNSLKLSKDKIIIGNQSWARTPGLFELLFYKNPNNFDKTELDIYKRILEKTNAFRRNFKPNGQIKGTRASKYQNIISNMLKDFKSGDGLMQLNLEKPNYLYWDDPNELVERLRLLIASHSAGHNNHNNEIISIIEELREANIII